MNKYMNMANEIALKGMKHGDGGPFGAVIVSSDGEVISCESNKVLRLNDPTAHAEINAIRMACKKLGTYDLSGCTLYTSCEPCPMCLSAVIWANIDKVYYGCTRDDAEDIGFRDELIYEYLKGRKKKIVDIKMIDREECLKAFDEYKDDKGTIY
ncbi:MAG: nucleoside deaminase [Bacilli bacterium]